MDHGDRLKPPATTNEPGHGRRLVSPGRFTADDGSTDLDICAALRAPVDPERLRDAMQAGRLIVAVVAMIANIFLAIPALSLTLSAVVVMIMAGLILFDTSRIIHGGETNYIRATVGLYLNIFNLFIHLLHLIAVFTGGDD